MRKLVLINILVLILKASSLTQQYLDYTNKLVNYNLLLERFDKVHSPLERDLLISQKKESVKKMVKIIRINLLSVFNKKAYVSIKEYVGTQLIKSYNKWLKLGDYVDKCKLIKVEFSKIIFKCSGKDLVKTLNKKNLEIKEQK